MVDTLLYFLAERSVSVSYVIRRRVKVIHIWARYSLQPKCKSRNPCYRKWSNKTKLKMNSHLLNNSTSMITRMLLWLRRQASDSCELTLMGLFWVVLYYVFYIDYMGNIHHWVSLTLIRYHAHILITLDLSVFYWIFLKKGWFTNSLIVALSFGFFWRHLSKKSRTYVLTKR